MIGPISHMNKNIKLSNFNNSTQSDDDNTHDEAQKPISKRYKRDPLDISDIKGTKSKKLYIDEPK